MQSYKMQVEFYDVDSLNVVWHGNYVKFLEKARCAFLSDLGYDYAKMQEEVFAYPVVKMDFKFIQPLFFKDIFEVRVELLQIEAFLKFAYTIFNAKGEKICKATTSQVCIKLDTKETLLATPQTLKECVKRFLGKDFLDKLEN